jgi:hypothetical protein
MTGLSDKDHEVYGAPAGHSVLEDQPAAIVGWATTNKLR